MKLKIMSLIVVTTLALGGQAYACGGGCKGGGSCGSGDSCGEGSCTCAKGPTTAQPNALAQNIAIKKEVGNTICPIEGIKIGSMGVGVKVEHKDKIYNLCCSTCIDKFKKKPKKYSKIADKEISKMRK